MQDLQGDEILNKKSMKNTSKKRIKSKPEYH